MSESITEQKVAAVVFFKTVMEEPVLRAALREHGLSSNADPSQFNSVLILTKVEWTLPYWGSLPKTLNVHFEARRPDEFRLEVGLEPYEGNVGQKPELMRRIEPVLALKTGMVRALRIGGMLIPLPARYQASVGHLPAPEETRSHTAIKFTSGLGADVTSRQAAAFYAEVIGAGAPLVEGVASLAWSFVDTMQINDI
ncbi:MAG TPA: hypothetical protein VFJ58_16430 [Armatimonadota bacterium]|nr:hypothetical protein [Armatimonadota bacterium]